MTRKLSIIVIAMLAAVSAGAGTPVFRTIKSNPVTPVKDQYYSGTCWCHASTALMESEAIRILGIRDEAAYPDFSELYTVSRAYEDRAVRYIRMDGHITSGPGSLGGDLLHVVEDWGIVPQSAMPGKTELPQLRDMDKEIRAYLDQIRANHGRLKGDWKKGLVKILDRTMGECPEKFTVDGKEYTPASYRDAMGIVPGDYLTFSSFTHVPFYDHFIIDVPDNWRWDTAFNVPLDELVETVRSAVLNGYTVAWGTDISEPGFSYESGLGFIPEKEVTQESRQRGYDVKETVDDHMMLIYGLAEDEQGNSWFMVKNSAGIVGPFDGMMYCSEDFFKAKTIYLTLHKDGVPQHIRDKFVEK
ncbi:MAG: hypothetical protein MJY42_05205 [Bacteroidales bacterium]|nr:hypothetical protein [Bacteroidales bacterium]